jgi:hypothetical protein
MHRLQLIGRRVKRKEKKKEKRSGWRLFSQGWIWTHFVCSAWAGFSWLLDAIKG